MIFVCEFERQNFAKKIGLGGKPNMVVHNGLWPEEFSTIRPDDDATDVLYLGDMRYLKGVDVLLKALALIQAKRPITACLVGDGPDIAEFKALANTLGLASRWSFPVRLPTAQALKRGKIAGSAVAGKIVPLCRARGGGGTRSHDRQRGRWNSRNFARQKTCARRKCGCPGPAYRNGSGNPGCHC